jgi:hypothetical protein
VHKIPVVEQCTHVSIGRAGRGHNSKFSHGGDCLRTLASRWKLDYILVHSIIVISVTMRVVFHRHIN